AVSPVFCSVKIHSMSMWLSEVTCMCSRKNTATKFIFNEQTAQATRRSCKDNMQQPQAQVFPHLSPPKKKKRWIYMRLINKEMKRRWKLKKKRKIIGGRT